MTNSFARFALAGAWLAMGALAAWGQDNGQQQQWSIEELTQLIYQNPKNADLYLRRAKLEAARGWDDSPVADFNMVIKLKPKLTEAYLGRADFYLAEQKWAKAIADYSSAIQRDPKNEQAYAGRAQSHQARHRGNEQALAVADFTEAIRLHPMDAKLYISRAQSYQDICEPDKAIADYTEAIRLKPSPDIYKIRGMINLSDGYYEAAIADFTESLRLSPGDMDVYSQRGDAYAHMGDYEKAIADYRNSVRGGGSRQIGLLYEAIGEKEKARAEYEVLLKHYQDQAAHMSKDASTLPYLNLGDIHEKMGDYTKALADYRKAMQLAPVAWIDYDSIATLYLKLGHRKLAFLYHDKAVEAARKNAAPDDDDPIETEQALYGRADDCVALGDYGQAIADYRTLAEMDPYDTYALGKLARIYAACPEKQFRNAAKAMPLALKVCQLSQWKDIDKIETLAAANALTGKFDAAVTWQQWAIELADAQKGDLRKDDATMQAMAARLALYQQKKPWREEINAK